MGPIEELKHVVNQRILKFDTKAFNKLKQHSRFKRLALLLVWASCFFVFELYWIINTDTFGKLLIHITGFCIQSAAIWWATTSLNDIYKKEKQKLSLESIGGNDCKFG